MEKRSKSINVFLMDGDSNGRIKCTLSNWTGVAFKIPRIELEKCKDRKELKQSGIYFLFGVSDDNEDFVYIGKAGSRNNGEGILDRLQEHNRNIKNEEWKEYWREAVVFTTSNHSFGQTEIGYLEHHFYELAKKSKRYATKNSNSTNPGNITEEKESELEEYIDYAKIIIGVLGYKIFKPLNESEENDDNEKKEILYLKRKEADAKCKQTAEGFVVLKGSKINKENKTSLNEKQKERRKKADLENNILKTDMLFASPSSAAVFVLGYAANGWIEWKNKEGKTLKEINN
ncbi:GIY-YIG nuclease family protein [Leptotrichia massiliensis]